MFNLKQVIAAENDILKKRRRHLFDEYDAESLHETKLGIAFSGGGIRSASICLGFVKSLVKLGILKKADYLSSVSGGGYTNAYVQSSIHSNSDYKSLGNEEFVEHMRQKGSNYMSFGSSRSITSKLLLPINIIIMIVLGFINPIIFLSIIVLAWYLIFHLLAPSIESVQDQLKNITFWMATVITVLWSSGIFLYYFIKMKYSWYQILNKVSIAGLGAFLFLIMIIFANTGVEYLQGWLPVEIWKVALSLVGLFILGYFTNINSISFGRLYGDSLARAFLINDRTVKLNHLSDSSDDFKKGSPGPYPLFNCCLNSNGFSGGSLTSDYFLLSPLYCGSKITRYIPTKEFREYRELTLSRAMTTSAAAINTGMGSFSSGIYSLIIGLFNFRTGALLPNPLKLRRGFFRSPLWWPIYYFRSLLSTNSLSDSALDISDGGHIENLGVFELLRRNCRLIISVDAGMDAEFEFDDLKNLIKRARNELGVELRFRADHDPFAMIRPGKSGFSKRRFVIADIIKNWDQLVPVGENGQFILDENGQVIKLLFNYGNIQKFLDKLNPKEKVELKEVLEKLDFKRNILDIVSLLHGDDSIQEKESFSSLTSNQNIMSIIVKMIDMCRNIRRDLQVSVRDSENLNTVLFQVVDILSDRMTNFFKAGTLVYIKSSITAPEGRPKMDRKDRLQYMVYKYKIYNYDFPHHSTIDQSFNPIQFQAYFELGKHLCTDALGIDNFGPSTTRPRDFSRDDLIKHFDEDYDLNQALVTDTIWEPESQTVPAEPEALPQIVESERRVKLTTGNIEYKM